MQDFLNYMGGQWTSSVSGITTPKFNPFDGRLLGQVTCSDAMDVIKALPFAKDAQQGFEKTSLLERAELLLKIADNLEANADRYALLEATHQGLPQKFVKENSVLVAADFFRQAAKACVQAERKKILAMPVGLLSIISTWCLSLRVISERLAPALAAGNAVLIKISELSPITAQILVEVFESATLPSGLVQLFQGNGNQVGTVLAAHPSIRAVSFIGKNANSEIVLKAAVAGYKKIQFSNGAKNSALVLNDTDYRSLMPEILKTFLWGQGQLCWNTHRLFIPEAMSADLVACLKEYLAQLKPAQSAQSDSLWMPLIQASAVDKTIEQSLLAQREHAKIVYGAEKEKNEGFFVKPTFTLDLTNCSVLQQDELHGPLFIITPVKYQHEMLKWSNTGYLGHSAVVWGPAAKVEKPAQGLQCSYVWTNSWLTNSDPIPGHKQSSFGNLDLNPFGSFFSDVKKMSIPSKGQETDVLKSYC